jgi:predicted O-methyltransferase YrrM
MARARRRRLQLSSRGVGSVDVQLADDLRREVGLVRAVETGTYVGDTARKLAGVFPAVITIERSDLFFQRASEALRDIPQITCVHGHSATKLRDVADATPSLYYLDAHWSRGSTSGEDDECPVLQEIEALRDGHPDDCVVIDDARLFAAAPPPPHKSGHWPTLLELFDSLRSIRPAHLVTVIDDQVIAAPARARAVVDAYAWRLQAPPEPPRSAIGRVVAQSAIARAAVRRLRRFID